MHLAPGSTRYGRFTTHNAGTGVLTNADSTPSVAVFRNGSSVSPTVTVANPTTGEYTYSYTVDAGWTAGDVVSERISATVSSLAGYQEREFIVDNTIGSRSTLTAANVWDLADGIETGFTPRGTMRIIAAAVAGKLSGGGTATETFRNLADGANRIVATVDASGNRTAITYNAA